MEQYRIFTEITDIQFIIKFNNSITEYVTNDLTLKKLV